MTTRILIGIFVATTVFLGGMQIVAAQSQTTQTAAPTGDSISTQLSTLSEVEAKIAAKIPEPVKNWFASLDQRRLAWAGQYAELRDKAQTGDSVQVKPNVQEGKVTVEYKPNFNYYLYYALAFFFLHAYVFYGVCLLIVFFILRIIFRSMNIIV